MRWLMVTAIWNVYILHCENTFSHEIRFIFYKMFLKIIISKKVYFFVIILTLYNKKFSKVYKKIYKNKKKLRR